MATRIRVNQSQAALLQANRQQTSAGRSNRIEQEQTKKALQKPLAQATENDKAKDDPFYRNGTTDDPAAFAKKKGQLIAASFIGCSLDFSDYWNIDNYRGSTYKIRGCTDDGTLSAWQSAAFRHPWELVGSDYELTASWNFELLKSESSVPDEGVIRYIQNGDVLKTDPQKYGSLAGCFTLDNYGDGWWYMIDPNITGAPLGGRPQPAYFESPLDYNLTPANIFESIVFSNLEEDTNLYPFPEYYTWTPANLSVAPFSYMLPFSENKAFLVVACVGISCPLQFENLQEYSIYAGIENGPMNIDFINPFGDPYWKPGTYFATRNTWDNTSSTPFMTSAWDTAGSSAKLTESVKADLYDIHVYEVTPGTVTKIIPPDRVIDNLRKFMHPHPADSDSTRTETFSTNDEGSQTTRNQSYATYVPYQDTRQLTVINPLKTDVHRPRREGPPREHQITYPDLNGAFNSHVEQTMPLWDTWNERRCLALQYGFGQITTQNHSYLKDEGLLSSVWGAFGETYDDPDGDNREWFKYYSPAIYEMIKGNGIAQDFYERFLNEFPQSETIITGPTGEQVVLHCPPHYLLDVTQSGPLKMTDPEQWPESLPSNVYVAANPDSLIDSGIEGGKVLDVATHVAYNWGNPWYCYDRLKELGFTNAELGERPSTNLTDGSTAQSKSSTAASRSVSSLATRKSTKDN